MSQYFKQHDSNELIQYYIVNKDLIEKYNMSTGKIAGQVAHLSTILAVHYLDSVEEFMKEKFFTWYDNKKHQKKIILQAHEKILLKLKEEGFLYIEDNGLTQIPKGSLTCVSLGIMTREEALPYTKRLQLLI